MDGAERKRTLREALVAAGVAGENLDRLARATNLTPEVVDEEIRSLADPRVRNKAAVLVKRLAARSGVELKKPRQIDSAGMLAIRQIEELRRARMQA
jgi:hypothetical protein